MKALFQNRRTRTSHRQRARRVGFVAAERLEPRQMLAADGLRTSLEQASMLVMDSSMVGPNPVVMSKSQVVLRSGTRRNSSGLMCPRCPRVRIHES
jgi:hypothetical protein